MVILYCRWRSPGRRDLQPFWSILQVGRPGLLFTINRIFEWIIFSWYELWLLANFLTYQVVCPLWFMLINWLLSRPGAPRNLVDRCKILQLLNRRTLGAIVGLANHLMSARFFDFKLARWPNTSFSKNSCSTFVEHSLAFRIWIQLLDQTLNK